MSHMQDVLILLWIQGVVQKVVHLYVALVSSYRTKMSPPATTHIMISLHLCKTMYIFPYLKLVINKTIFVHWFNMIYIIICSHIVVKTRWVTSEYVSPMKVTGRDRGLDGELLNFISGTFPRCFMCGCGQCPEDMYPKWLRSGHVVTL